MVEIINGIRDLINERKKFVLASIIEMHGSAPRGKGSKMIVNEDGTISGTVGGGKIEALTIRIAQEIYQSQKPRIEYFSLSSQDASSIGMVCGGQVKMMFEYIDLTDEAVFQVYRLAADLYSQQKSFTMVTRFNNEETKESAVKKWICTSSASTCNNSEIPAEVLKYLSYEEIQILDVEGSKYILEPFIKQETVMIFGAGHVGKALSEVTGMLNFWTVVIDDREEFANKQNLPNADEIYVIDSLSAIPETINIVENTYVIIVTRGHLHDKSVLKHALKTKAKYIGMIGSRTKRDIVYNELFIEGFAESDIQRVHAPIGIHISAETPAEIAVSIASELIAVRRQSDDR